MFGLLAAQSHFQDGAALDGFSLRGGEFLA
jgi:hypothetical protein